MLALIPLLAIGLGIFAVTAYWDRIRDWAITTAADWVRAHLGAGPERWLRAAVVVLDRVLNPWQRLVRRSLVARAGAGEAVVTEEEVPLEDLPAELRAQVLERPVAHTYEV